MVVVVDEGGVELVVVELEGSVEVAVVVVVLLVLVDVLVVPHYKVSVKFQLAIWDSLRLWASAVPPAKASTR